VSLIPPETVDRKPSSTTAPARSTAHPERASTDDGAEDGSNLLVRGGAFAIVAAAVLGGNAYLRARRRRA
jgi:hypothetical protein